MDHILKTLRDTAAPLGYSELVARRRGPVIEDDLVFGRFLENISASLFSGNSTIAVLSKNLSYQYD